jgi:Putative transmembrane protein precursor
MQPGFIGKEIKRTNQNLFFTGAGMVGLPIAIGVFGFSYWMSFFGGPKQISSQELATSPSKYFGQYVTISGSDNVETGWQQISQRKSKYTGEVKSESVSARFLAIKMPISTNQNRVLLAKIAPEATASNTVTGKIDSIPSLVENELTGVPNRDKILPVMIDAQGNFYGLGIFGIIVGGFSGIIGVGCLVSLKQRKENLGFHPIIKNLNKYGRAEAVAQQIDQEFNNQDVIVRNKTRISKSWLIQQESYETKFRQIKDIVWLYFQVTTHRTNGIPTGKTYSAIFCDRYGNKTEVAGTEEESVDLVKHICSLMPWAISGHSDDVQRAWDKDRAALIASVDAARQQFRNEVVGKNTQQKAKEPVGV